MRSRILGAAMVLMAAWYGQAWGIPTLQLDIEGGEYDQGTQGVITHDSLFTLYALLYPGGEKAGNAQASLYETGTTNFRTFYLSVAVLGDFADPAGGSGPDLGSFTIGGNTVRVTEDMTYGIPPATAFEKDLAGHGVFDTYFLELAFTFDPIMEATPYNVQDNPGGPDQSTGTEFYYASWLLDTSGLNSGVYLHFDVYTLMAEIAGKSSNVVQKIDFAPFSHDAQTVPEPGTMLLLGSGLLGLGYKLRGRGRSGKG